MYALQRASHLCCRSVSVLASVGACLVDHVHEPAVNALERRKRFSRKPSVERLFLIIVRDLRRKRRQERRPCPVEHGVHDYAERVDVHCLIVELSLVDFRRHVGIGSFSGKLAVRLLYCSGDPEITELVIAALRDKYVFGFYISVDYIVLFAQFQTAAKINPELDDVLYCHSVFRSVPHQRSQEFHSDQDIVTDIIIMLYYSVIFVAYDIAVAFQLTHDHQFADDIFDNIVVIPLDGILRGAFHPHPFDFIIALRNRNDLQRRAVDFAEFFFLYLEYSSEAALSQNRFYIPRIENWFKFLAFTNVHVAFLSNLTAELQLCISSAQSQLYHYFQRLTFHRPEFSCHLRTLRSLNSGL